MSIFGFLRPRPTLSEEELKTGLRWMTLEGTVSIGFFSVTGSGILAAFALALGANNFDIGVLAAIPFVMQTIQIPAIWLVEKIRRRKLITVSNWFSSQLFWFPIALIPFFLPAPGRNAINMLLLLMVLRSILSAICNAAWNGWQRDLIPQTILGRFFSRRLAYATISGIVLSLGAALFIDYYKGTVPAESAVFGYSYVLLFCISTLGIASPIFMSMIPEPLMQPVTGPQPSMKQRLMAPLRDINFRRLLQFLFYWSFSSNLAIPFFAVHMLQRLGLPISWVIGLSILSQLFNILFLRVWGPFADRFSNKSVLSVGVSLYLLVIFGWIFTTMPEKYFLTIPLLVLLHIFAGIASAAVSFTVGTIGLKLSPQSQSTSYLAVASLAINLGSGLGPLLGGVLADFFSTRQLNLIFNWADPTGVFQFTAMNISGRDFLFGIAFIVGLLTLGILALIREEGEAGREVILESLFSPMREFSRPMSSVPGFTFLSNFPFGFLKRVPIPGLDVALGVTVYQIAEMARAAALAAVKGRRMTKRLATELSNTMHIGRSRREVRHHGIEVTRHMARGAMHVVDEKPIKAEQLAKQVMEGVIAFSGKSGIKYRDAILGASQGIVQGAAETGTDITAVTARTLETARKSVEQTGLSEEEAESIAARGVLLTAEALGPEVAAEAVEAIPEKVLSSIKPEA
jgi:MFS family permease